MGLLIPKTSIALTIPRKWEQKDFRPILCATIGIEPQHIYFVLRPIRRMCCYTDTYKLQKGKDKSKNRTKIKN